jgi:heme-degrading monooxygenase HmoA
MILEIAVLYIIPGNNKAFEADFKEAGQYISSIEGYRKHTLQKCIENTNKYVLLVEWETLEDHTRKFRDSEAYQSWKKLLHHHYDPFPVVEHFEEVII